MVAISPPIRLIVGFVSVIPLALFTILAKNLDAIDLVVTV